MADRSQVTKITLAYLKDPKNMPKDNTPEASLESELEDLELPEELPVEDNGKVKKKKKKEQFPTGEMPIIEGGNPGLNPRSKDDLFNKKKEVY